MNTGRDLSTAFVLIFSTTRVKFIFREFLPFNLRNTAEPEAAQYQAGSFADFVKRGYI